ncbi:hypothetical protein PMAYCL1PPCAC_19624, partial [Pristionchus mayeri]
LYLSRRKNLASDFAKKLEEVKTKHQRGSADSRFLAWNKREKIWRRKREEDEIKAIERLNQKNKELIEFLQKNSPFPFMGLPDELISDIISILDMKDRLRARVNKRLDKIELESKYHIKNLHIKALKSEWLFNYYMQFPVISLFFWEKSYSSECIKRISRNVSIGNLWIELSGSDDFHRQVSNLIKEF